MMHGWMRSASWSAAVCCLFLGTLCLLMSVASAGAAEKPPASKAAPAKAPPKAAPPKAAPPKAAPPKAGPFKSEAPLTITGDRMEVSQRDRTIVFEGRVTVQQEDLTITGKRMKVIAAAADKGKPTPKDPDQDSSGDMPMMGRIDRIEMEGGVRIAQREKVATAEKAVYYHGEKKIVLLGSPVVSQGADQIKGRMITLFLADGRSIVEGGESTPVQAILHPRKDKE